MENHTPVRAKLLLEAIEGILTYNVLDIVPRIEEIILNDDIDNQMRIEGVKSEITTAIKEILKFMGITPYHAVNDFIVISKIINGMDKCVNEYYPEYIMDNTLLESDEESDLDKIYSIIKLIEDQKEIDFYDVIHSVKDTVVPELVTILNSKVMPEIEGDDQVIVRRYHEFIKGVSRGVVFEYIRNNGTIGTIEDMALMTLFSDAIMDLPVPDRPFDIISAILISDIDTDEVPEAIKRWGAFFSENDSELAMIERECAKLYQ